jgi:hypothetical protein
VIGAATATGPIGATAAMAGVAARGAGAAAAAPVAVVTVVVAGVMPRAGGAGVPAWRGLLATREPTVVIPALAGTG